MKRPLRWRDLLTINAYWLGANTGSGILTPVLVPFLVALFMPAAQKNSYLATVRVIGLAVAMLVQPLAGMLSDRSTSRFGRRRPFIATGALFSIVFLLIIGASPALLGPSSATASRAYLVLIAGMVLLQASANVAQGALQGLIPDIVPENQRGRASGVKSVFELLPIFVVIFVGPLVDAGRIWPVIGIMMAAYAITAAINVLSVRETPLREKPVGSLLAPILRLVALTAIFVGSTQVVVWLVKAGGQGLREGGAAQAVQVGLLGIVGLVGMAGAIFVGVYAGAWVGIGPEARQQKSFIWWVINRLLFLAAVGSIQGFALYYLRDFLGIPNAASMTTVLLGMVALFLLPAALGGGFLADRLGRKRLVALAGLIAAAGTGVLLLARDLPLVLVSGCIIGLATGIFMAVNWALGTDLAPAAQAGKYLGISNLAGAGAGIVGAGIGGPLADAFNALRPGLGYLVIFAIYGGLFLLSVAALSQVHVPREARG
jgi:Na+/melibiose symporter-like transporter